MHQTPTSRIMGAAAVFLFEGAGRDCCPKRYVPWSRPQYSLGKPSNNADIPFSGGGAYGTYPGMGELQLDAKEISTEFDFIRPE